MTDQCMACFRGLFVIIAGITGYTTVLQGIKGLILLNWVCILCGNRTGFAGDLTQPFSKQFSAGENAAWLAPWIRRGRQAPAQAERQREFALSLRIYRKQIVRFDSIPVQDTYETSEPGSNKSFRTLVMASRFRATHLKITQASRCGDARARTERRAMSCRSVGRLAVETRKSRTLCKFE